MTAPIEGGGNLELPDNLGRTAHLIALTRRNESAVAATERSMAESMLDFLAEFQLPWYVVVSVILLPILVSHFRRTPREQWKREFFRLVVWYLFAGYTIVWAFQRFVLSPIQP